MTKITNFTLSICALFLCLSCEKDSDIPAPSRQMTFTAYQESVTTRTTLGSGSGTNKTMLWSSGDKISVLYQDISGNSQNVQFALSSGVRETKGTFTGTLPTDLGGTSYLALYPYQSAAKYSDENIANVSIPQIQKATAGSFDPDAAVMVAKSDATDGVFAFKNVCSYAVVTPKFDCKSIIIRSVGGETIVCQGTLTSPLSSSSSHLSSLISSPQVTLVGDIKANTSYYIALLPQTLSQGFSVAYFTDHSQVNRTNTDPFTFERSQYHDISNSCPESAPTTLRYVDLGLSVNWATMNLGAVKQTDMGLSFAWGETAPKYSYNWENYKWGDGSEHTTITSEFVSKYNSSDNKSPLDSSDDAATAIWGTAWRIPTQNEMQELIKECNWEYESATNRYKVTSKKTGYTDNFIYIPVDATSGSRYWTSSVSDATHYTLAHSLRLTPPDDIPSDDISLTTDSRYTPLLIRPVKTK